MGTLPCVLRSAYAEATADTNEKRTRRSFSEGGQAQHEGSLSAMGVCAIKNLLILSLSKDARCGYNDT
jgi:hypothetical protein